MLTLQRKTVSLRGEFRFPVPKNTTFLETARRSVTRQLVVQLALKYSIAGLFSLIRKVEDPVLSKQLRHHANQSLEEATILNEMAKELDLHGYRHYLDETLVGTNFNLTQLNLPGAGIFHREQASQLQCFQDQLNAIPREALYQSLSEALDRPFDEIKQNFETGAWRFPEVKSPQPSDGFLVMQSHCGDEALYTEPLQSELMSLASNLTQYSQQILALHSLVVPMSSFPTLLAVNGALDFIVTFTILSHATYSQLPTAAVQKRLHLASVLTAAAAPWIAAAVDYGLGMGPGVTLSPPPVDGVAQKSQELFDYQESCYHAVSDDVAKSVQRFPLARPHASNESLTSGHFKVSNSTVISQQQTKSQYAASAYVDLPPSQLSASQRDSFTKGPTGGDAVFGVTSGRIDNPYVAIYQLKINDTDTTFSVDPSYASVIKVTKLSPGASENMSFRNGLTCQLNFKIGDRSLVLPYYGYSIKLTPSNKGYLSVSIEGIPFGNIPVSQGKIPVTVSASFDRSVNYYVRYNTFESARSAGTFDLCVYKIEPSYDPLDYGPRVLKSVFPSLIQQQPPCDQLKPVAGLGRPKPLDVPMNSSEPLHFRTVYPKENIAYVAAHSAVQGGLALASAVVLFYAAPAAVTTLMAIQLAHNVTGQASTGPMAVAANSARSLWSRLTGPQTQRVMPFYAEVPEEEEDASDV